MRPSELLGLIISICFVLIGLATIVVVIFGVTHFQTPNVKLEHTCQRVLVATPHPSNSDSVFVQEMRVCGIDLEWQRIQPYEGGGKDV